MSQELIPVSFQELGDTAPPSQAFVEACRRTKRTVEVRLVYVRFISDVDDLSESFKAAFGLDMYWRASEEDQKQFKADPATFTPQFIPTFEFPNARDVVLEKRPLVSGSPFKVTKDGMCFLRTFCLGTFMATFDLQNYPYDIQNLTVVMDLSFDPKEDVILVPGQSAFPLDGKPPGDGSIVQFNRAFSSVPQFKPERVLCEFVVRENSWSQMRLTVQVSRHPFGILMRVGLLVLLLGLSTLVTFALDPIDHFSDRVNFLITLILAFTAFMFVISSSVPLSPHLTLLHKYSLANFSMVVILLFVIAIMQVLSWSADQLHSADSTLFTVMAVLDGAVQVIFGVTSLISFKVEKGKLHMSSFELDRLKDDQKPIFVKGSDFIRDSKKNAGLDPSVTFQATHYTY